MPPHRVLHVITRLEQGGAPLALLETVKRMDRKRFDVTLVVGQTEDLDRDLDLELAGDLPVIRVPAMRRSIHPVRDAVALAQLVGIIRDGEYDLVHTHTSKAGILGRVAAALCGTRAIVHSSHGTILEGYFGPAVTRIFAFLEAAGAALSDRIVCLTAREIDQYLSADIGRRDQFAYIFNGIDVDAFASRAGDRNALRGEFGFCGDHVVCLTVGRLVPVKGQADLLEAFAAAHRENDALRLLVVGDGELMAQLGALADRLGIASVTRFTGWREDVPELMDAADMFVLTSHNEGLGLVLVEAMAKGLPVVATAVGGVPEVVDDGVTGHLVPARDAGAIATAVLDLAASPDRRRALGAQGRERARETFSIEQTVARTQDLYLDLLGEPA